MYKYIGVIIFLVMPMALQASGNRFADNVQRTQRGDYLVGIGFTGDNFRNPSVYWYLNNQMALGVYLLYNRYRESLPEDQVKLDSRLGLRLAILREIWGDNNPVIAALGGYLALESKKDKTDNGELSNGTSSSLFGFGALFTATIYMTYQFAVAINALAGLRFGTNTYYNGTTNYDGKFSKFKLGVTPRLILIWNFN